MSYKGHTEDDIRNMYDSEQQVRDMLLNVTSALRLELNLRLKSFQLIENVRKYNPESLIGNAGKNKRPYSKPILNIVKMRFKQQMKNTILLCIFILQVDIGEYFLATRL